MDSLVKEGLMKSVGVGQKREETGKTGFPVCGQTRRSARRGSGYVVTRGARD